MWSQEAAIRFFLLFVTRSQDFFILKLKLTSGCGDHVLGGLFPGSGAVDHVSPRVPGQPVALVAQLAAARVNHHGPGLGGSQIHIQCPSLVLKLFYTSYLYSEISCQLPCVGMILLLLELNLSRSEFGFISSRLHD